MNIKTNIGEKTAKVQKQISEMGYPIFPQLCQTDIFSIKQFIHATNFAEEKSQ